MGYRHLTDFEIQEALDGTLSHSKPLLQLHLDKCELCELRLLDYRKVVESFSSADGEKFTASSVDAVMKRIESIEASQRPVASLTSTIGWIGAGLSAVASIVWVIGRTDFASGVRELAVSYVHTASSQSDKILPLVSNNMLAFAGVAAIGVMMAVDSIIRKRVATGVNLFSV
jgi:hypothetical protein